MPKKPKDEYVLSQFVFKAEEPKKVEVEAIATAMERSAGWVLREMLEIALPEMRRRAQEETDRRAGLPHGITADAVEKAMTALMRRFLLSEPFRLDPKDVFTADSKALWVLLGYIWDDTLTDPERERADKVFKQFAKKAPKE